MKISPKKRGQIYDCVHTNLMELRIDLRTNYLKDNPLRDKVDVQIAQVEAPLAQEIIKLIQGKSKE